jgi:hypothetical protein
MSLILHPFLSEGVENHEAIPDFISKIESLYEPFPFVKRQLIYYHEEFMKRLKKIEDAGRYEEKLKAESEFWSLEFPLMRKGEFFDMSTLFEMNRNLIWQNWLRYYHWDKPEMLGKRWCVMLEKGKKKSVRDLIYAKEDMIKEMNRFFGLVKTDVIWLKLIPEGMGYEKLTDGDFKKLFNATVTLCPTEIGLNGYLEGLEKIRQYNKKKKREQGLSAGQTKDDLLIEDDTEDEEKEEEEEEEETDNNNKKTKKEKKPVNPKLRYYEKSPAQIWLQSPNRKRYSQIVFDPTPASFENILRDPQRDNRFNTYVGFDYEPIDVCDFTDFTKLRFFFLHLRWNWCANEEEFCYLLGLIAWIFQFPWLPSKIALCVGGRQGSGKSVIMEILRKIIGKRLAIILGNVNDLSDQFNGHFIDKILVVMEEMLSGNSKQMACNIKSFITATEVRERGMYRDPIYKENYANWMFCSNFKENMQYSENDMRRFFMLESDTHILASHDELFQCLFKNISTTDLSQRHDLFVKKMLADLSANDNEGLKTLANFFYSLNLDNFNVRDHPVTWLRLVHIMNGISSVYSWWLECIIRGYQAPYQQLSPESGTMITIKTWRNEVSIYDLYEDYQKSPQRSSDNVKRKVKTLLQFQLELLAICKPIKIETVSLGSVKNQVAKYIPSISECIDYFELVVPGVKEYLNHIMFTNELSHQLQLFSSAAVPHQPPDPNTLNRDPAIILNPKRSLEIKKYTAQELLTKFLPTDFYGSNLLDQLNKGKLKPHRIIRYNGDEILLRRPPPTCLNSSNSRLKRTLEIIESNLKEIIDRPSNLAQIIQREEERLLTQQQTTTIAHPPFPPQEQQQREEIDQVSPTQIVHHTEEEEEQQEKEKNNTTSSSSQSRKRKRIPTPPPVPPSSPSGEIPLQPPKKKAKFLDDDDTALEVPSSQPQTDFEAMYREEIDALLSMNPNFFQELWNAEENTNNTETTVQNLEEHFSCDACFAFFPMNQCHPCVRCGNKLFCFSCKCKEHVY